MPELFHDNDLSPPASLKSSEEHHRLTLASVRASNDSSDSLRNLELSEGPMAERGRSRSYSMTGFDFQRDLLPLSSSLSEPDTTSFGEIGEKNITLLHGIGLIVGLQIGSGIL
jgi:hypothetical protein